MEPPSSPCPPRRMQRVTPERSLAPPSSPTSRRSGTSTKSTKLPSVTPRRFKKFFTPRSAQQAAGPQSAQLNRTALGDISTTGGNRRLAHSSPIKHIQTRSRNLFDADENGYTDQLESTPERPSPLKRLCNVHPRDLTAEVIPLSSQEIPSSPPACPDSPIARRVPPKPIQRSAFRKTYGSVLRRETDLPASSFKKARSGICATNIQSETAHFYSTSDDFHESYNFDYLDGTTGAERQVTPFCFVPCNTNSLAAIGDEEGYVRLVETGKDQDPPMAKDFLHFRPHKNAILHVDFCEDDSLLATASGDQTSQVIDMKTQKAISTLWGHRSSLRQVRFQPGTGGKVIATSGRDGLIMIWDLRCTPSERPGPSIPTMSIGGGITTLDADKDRKFAQYKHQFMPPIPRTKDANGSTKYPNEKSVTAISFLSSSSNNYVLSASATGPAISLWDIRKMRVSALSGQNALVGRAVPNDKVKNTRGLLSMSLSTDQSRIYALSRDSTAYVYSTAQLLASSTQPAEALYGLRHKDMTVTTWYHSLSLRKSTGAQNELLAVGGFGGNVVVFPTNEDYLRSRSVKSSSVRNGVKIYEHGTVLRGGHNAEVSSVAWSSDGELCTASDDYKCRVWREDEAEAKKMRVAVDTNDGETDVRWCGWAEVKDDWAEDDFE